MAVKPIYVSFAAPLYFAGPLATPPVTCLAAALRSASGRISESGTLAA